MVKLTFDVGYNFLMAEVTEMLLFTKYYNIIVGNIFLDFIL